MRSEITDEGLMERYKNGSMEAFEELYDRHKAKVYGYLGKRVKSRCDRDEIHQNVFLKLHRSRQSYDSSLPFLPWLFTVCRNVLIDFVRTKEAKEGRLVAGNGLIDSLAVTEEAEVSGLDRLAPAMSKLNEDQREAIRMRYGEDFSFEEIARRLSTTEPNARQMISRALKKLKGLVNPKEHL